MNDSGSFVADEDDTDGGMLVTLPSILRQRWLYILIPLVLFSIAGVAAAFLLPRVYTSSALFLVESQDLPNDVVNNAGDNVIDRRIAKIRQQILSRPDLVELIQANDLYDVSRRSKPLSDLVTKMRDSTRISAVDADIAQASSGRGGSSSIAFSLAFDYPTPDKAQAVAQAFVNQLLELDASETLKQAENSVRFLEDQESTLRSQVNGIETQINRLTGQNGLALSNPGSTAMMGVGAGGGYETQVAELQRENAQLSAQISANAAVRDPLVATAEAQLAAAKATFSDDHPDVRLAENRLAAAKSSASTRKGADTSSILRSQIAANTATIGSLARSRSVDQGRAAAMMAAQARGPAVMQQVSQLQARLDLLSGNLGKITTNLMNARSMAKLANEQRAERLTLIDPPVTPDKPTSPNRPLVIAFGIAAGAGLGMGLILLIELLRRPIRGVGALTRLLGAPPLVVIPVLDRKARGNMRKPRSGKRWLPWPFQRSRRRRLAES